MKLKEIREAKGVKQKSVANRLGITRQTYASHELNPKIMTLGEAMAVCDFLSIKPDEVDDFFMRDDVISAEQ